MPGTIYPAADRFGGTGHVQAAVKIARTGYGPFPATTYLLSQEEAVIELLIVLNAERKSPLGGADRILDYVGR